MPGYSCAWIAVTAWAPSSWGVMLRNPADIDAWMRFSLGWFNVTNLLGFLAPSLVIFPGIRRFSGVFVLGCALGAAQALSLVSGSLGGEPLWKDVAPGFGVWCAGYLSIAGAAGVLGRRVRTP
ncbi:MAG: hypothetical protein JNL10_12620 [Verrucomicrobiales bacterium]|nr:hypothetical protein [Verrucomicrobiales bacterium]